ncbi:hypothetical protein [Kitasatospora xanthocidica]|uniref:hypothetical protein n=1 Tax=Kitasatospora xanthocidica TaxID=83382 RepID=UPI0011C3CA5B|nr:hypothetical protein [Kitasatospora xanthocidica]
MTTPQNHRRPLQLPSEHPVETPAENAEPARREPRVDPWEGLVPPPPAPVRPTSGRRTLAVRPSDSAG